MIEIHLFNQKRSASSVARSSESSPARTMASVRSANTAVSRRWRGGTSPKLLNGLNASSLALSVSLASCTAIMRLGIARLRRMIALRIRRLSRSAVSARARIFPMGAWSRSGKLSSSPSSSYHFVRRSARVMPAYLVASESVICGLPT